MAKALARIAAIAGVDFSIELAEQVLDYLDIPVPDEDDLDQVLPVGDQVAQPFQVGEPVAVLALSVRRVHEPYREFSVGVEIHSRSPSCS